MKVIMLNDLFAIGACKKESNTSLLKMPQDINNTGMVRYIGADYKGPLEVGMLVFYGNDRNQVKISGVELEIMEPSNIFGILEEEQKGVAESKKETT